MSVSSAKSSPASTLSLVFHPVESTYLKEPNIVKPSRSHSTDPLLPSLSSLKPIVPKRVISAGAIINSASTAERRSPLLLGTSPRAASPSMPKKHLAVRVHADNSPSSGGSISSFSSPRFAGTPLNTAICQTPDGRGLRTIEETTRNTDAATTNRLYVDKLRASFAKVLPFQALNTLSLRAVGRSISQDDIELLKLVHESIQLSHSPSLSPKLHEFAGITRRIRGTYFIQDPRPLRDFMEPIKAIEEHFTDQGIVKTIVSYCVNAQFIAVFKPADEARGMPNCRSAQSALGEIHPGQYGIAPDMDFANQNIAGGLHQIGYPVLEATLQDDHFYDRRTTPGTLLTKIGSLQPFIPDTISLGDPESQPCQEAVASIPLDRLQETFILDLCLVNTDRNSNNLLYNPTTKQLFPIDHALLYPAQFKTAAELTWLNWKAAHQPLRQKALEKIAALHFEKDMAKILASYPNYPLESLETMRIAYSLLQMGVRVGLTPFQMGCFYTGNPASPMKNLYEKARETTDDPELFFRRINECLESVMKDLMTRYPQLAIAAKADTEKYPLWTVNRHLQKNVGSALHASINAYFGDRD